jgi:hypothetical protein
MGQYYQLKAAGNYAGALAELNTICPMSSGTCPAAMNLAKAAQFAHDVGAKFSENANSDNGDSKFAVSAGDTAFLQRFNNPNKDGNYLLTTIGQERNLPQMIAVQRQLGATAANGDNPFAATINASAAAAAAASVDLGTKAVPATLLFDSRGNASLRVLDQNSPWGAYNPNQYKDFSEPQVIQYDPNAQLRPMIGTGAASATANPIQPQFQVPSVGQQQFLPQSLRGNARPTVM